MSASRHSSSSHSGEGGLLPPISLLGDDGQSAQKKEKKEIRALCGKVCALREGKERKKAALALLPSKTIMQCTLLHVLAIAHKRKSHGA